MDVAVIEAPTALPDTGFAQAVNRLADEMGAGRPLRFDLAWQLLLPSSLGGDAAEIPAGNPRTRMRAFLDWARETIAAAGTTLRDGTAVALAPRLSAAASEWLFGYLSLFAKRVGHLRCAGPDDLGTAAAEWQAFRDSLPSRFRDGWTPPVIRPWEPSALLDRTGKTTAAGQFRYLGARIPSDRLAVQTYRLRPGGHGNRLHVHSDVDECFVVLSGAGFVRTADRLVPVAAGDVVLRPSGAGLASEFIAGPDGLTVLDIEAWRHFSQTDVVAYPDHRERYLRGPGLELACPEDALFSGEALMAAYDSRYVRHADGTTAPPRGDEDPEAKATRATPPQRGDQSGK